MPITIKSSRMQYRKSNGDYVGVDAVSERKTSEYVSDIESIGNATQSAIEQTASTASDAIDTKAQQARDSIPSDYTALSDEVSDLKSATSELSNTINAHEYASELGLVSGLLGNDGNVSPNNNYKTSAFIPLHKGETFKLVRTNSDATYELVRCIYNSEKVFQNIVTINASTPYNYYVTDDIIYARVSVPNAVADGYQIIVNNYKDTEYHANYSFSALKDGTNEVVLESGNISASGGTDADSNYNFRTKGYLPESIKSVSCNGKLRFAIAKYYKNGLFKERTGFTYTTFSSFDYDTEEYRIAFNKTDSTAIVSSDYDEARFSNTYLKALYDLTSAEDTYTNYGSVQMVMEQGNINTSGAEVTSNVNIRSRYMLPENVKSISTDGIYTCGVARYNKSTGTFASRSAITYHYYDDFDFDTYSYRVLMGNTPLINMSTADADKLHINTATLDLIVKNEQNISEVRKNAGLPLLNNYLNKNGYDVMSRSLKGIGVSNDYMASGFNLTDANKKSHDATICILNDIVYCVRSVYVGDGDNASSDDATVVLTTCGLDGSNVNNISVGKKGDTLGGVAITGGCGSPNLFLDGTDVHILFTAHISGDYTIFHCVYDTTNSTLGNYARITINNSICSVSVVNQLLNMYYGTGQFNGMQMNASLAYDSGVVYGGLCAGTDGDTGRGVILKSSDFVNWQTFAIINPDIITPVYEIACAILSDYLYVMARPAHNTLKGYIAKCNVSNGDVVQQYDLLNGSSRPDFIVMSGEIYLFNTDDRQRYSHSVIKVNASNINASEMIVQCNANFDYLRCFVYDSKIYACSTVKVNGINSIHINVLDLNIVSDATVLSGLTSLISN